MTGNTHSQTPFLSGNRLREKTIGGGRGKGFQPINKFALPLEKTIVHCRQGVFSTKEMYYRYYPYWNFPPSTTYSFWGQPSLTDTLPDRKLTVTDPLPFYIHVITQTT